MATSSAATQPGSSAREGSLLSKERIIAKPGFNRWLVPPAALAIHLCIGMAYGFSVFWLPLSKAVGLSAPLACPDGTSFWTALFITTCDWKVSTLGWMFTTWVRARHGYPVENEWTGTVHRTDPDAGRKIDLLSSENEKLTGRISRLEERIAVLERIAIDPAARTARDIVALR